MATELKVIVNEVATDGLPDMDRLTGRVAFIWDGSIVSGWPIWPVPVGDPKNIQWEPDEDRFGGPVTGVTHWIEFPFPLWKKDGYDNGD